MSWPTGNLPAEVTAMRDMIGASAYWLAAAGGVSQIHYPDFTIDTNTVFPAMLIVRETHRRDTYAAGSGALPSGEIRLELYGAVAVDVLEYVAQGIAADIAASTTGLAIRSCEVGMAGDISNARRAAIDNSDATTFRAIPIKIMYGLTL